MSEILQESEEEINAEQVSMFEDEVDDFQEKWKGMPEFNQEDLEPVQSVIIHFDSIKARKDFAKLIDQTITGLTQSVWYPKADIGRIADKRYFSKDQVNPRYPVYVISKGRWESRLTQKALERIGVPYHIVIEPQECKQYSAVVDPSKILQLPFSNLGQGSIPARNWVWDHAISIGAERHWILDDNMDGFYRLNNNLKVQCETGATFRAAEDFSDRYENVGISGFNYFMFAPRKSAAIKPFTLNTRIYSCILIKNDIPYRWRGRYNEDTDLSIRALKDGWCTVLFNAFLTMKQTTMTMKGGNTDELYQKNEQMDGRLLMAQSLQEQHPDIVQITEKWGRYQHHVDYHIFRRNKLIPKEGLQISDRINNYGMELKMIEEK